MNHMPLVKLSVGEPCKLGEQIGRIVGFDTSSAQLHGEFAVVAFGTPNGEIFKAGRANIKGITDKIDLEELVTHEQKELKEKGVIYNGLLQ